MWRCAAPVASSTRRGDNFVGDGGDGGDGGGGDTWVMVNLMKEMVQLWDKVKPLQKLEVCLCVYI